MPFNITQKIMAKHLVEGTLKPKSTIGLKIDQTLTQDATGTMTYLEFSALNLDRVRTEVSVSYVDHNLLQTDFKNPDDHRFLQSTAARYGLWFSPVGNGICHQLHMLDFGRPGATLLGSDSHTPHCGGLGMLAMGAGGLDVAAAMAGYPFYLTCPSILGVCLQGELPPNVEGKDIILELLRRLSVKGGVGWILEYFGPGVKSLNMSQRAAICNMGAELGATTSIFPSDEITKAFLLSQARPEHYLPLAADPDAAYERIEEIDLSSLEPLVACPSSPDKIKPALELSDVKVEQVIVGSCGGGFYEDLMTLALLLQGKRIAPWVNLYVNPGSRQALYQLAETGGYTILLQAGATIFQPGCLGCIGMSQAPATGTNSLRTFPRNFPGRSGTKDDQVYLAGPAVAAATALKGYIADPRSLPEIPALAAPPSYKEEGYIAPLPENQAKKTEILRGPNIAPFPELAPLPEKLSCIVALKTGDNVTTDHISPAGAEALPLRSNIPAIAQFVFRPLDPDFSRKAATLPAVAIVGGENYGQGSSREHAALAPRYLGVAVKLVKSFARIHKANLINFGIVPLVFKDVADYERINENDQLEIPNLLNAIKEGRNEIIVNINGNPIITLLDVSARERDLLAAGGLLNHIKNRV